MFELQNFRSFTNYNKVQVSTMKQKYIIIVCLYRLIKITCLFIGLRFNILNYTNLYYMDNGKSMFLILNKDNNISI